MAKKVELKDVKTVEQKKPTVIGELPPEDVKVAYKTIPGEPWDEPKVYHKIEGKSLSSLFARYSEPNKNYIVLLEDNTEVTVSKDAFEIFAKLLNK